MHATDSNRQPILPIADVQLGPLSTIDFNVSQEVELLHSATPRENTMRCYLQHVPQPAATTYSDRRTLARDQAVPQTVEAREILVALHQGFVLTSASPEVHRGEHGQGYCILHGTAEELVTERELALPTVEDAQRHAARQRGDVLWKHLKHLLVRFT